MQIRKATVEELERIMEIYAQAREFMRQQGNPNQWGSNRPSRQTVLEDIQHRHCNLCVEDGEILGVFCYFQGDDPTYAKIYQGQWLNDEPYGVIHRIAVAAHGRGVASACFAYAMAQCRNLRIDTHRDNIPMQRALAKNGFVRCGIIYIESGDERIAFQKTV